MNEGQVNGEKFRVKLDHLMEDILQTYSFEEWKIPIVENVDNFIDETGYHTMQFFVKKDLLIIKMIGTGIPEERFSKLAEIAFTTKFDEKLKEKRKGLGYFGWGLKATMAIADKVEIETKYKDFRGRQVWYWHDKEPYWKMENPTFKLEEDQTVIVYYLNQKFHNKLSEQRIIETLQEFYPTVLAGAPALGKKRKFFVNNKEVPKPEWLNAKRYKEKIILRDIVIDGNPITGRIFISEKELKEELRGLAVIVCGRNIINERFHPYPEVKVYTGYVHADFFFKYLIGDKTQIKKSSNPLWAKFKVRITAEIKKELSKRGLLPKVTIKDKEVIRRVNKVISSVFQEIPELQRYGVIGPRWGEGVIYMRGGEEILVDIQYGPSSKTDIPHKDHRRGVDQPGGGEEGPIIQPSQKGTSKAKKKKGRKRVFPQCLASDDLPQDIEARYEGEDVILISKNHPNYQYASRLESLRCYHMSRAGLEAVIDYLLREGIIDVKKYLELKKQILYTLGNAL